MASTTVNFAHALCSLDNKAPICSRRSAQFINLPLVDTGIPLQIFNAVANFRRIGTHHEFSSVASYVDVHLEAVLRTGRLHGVGLRNSTHEEYHSLC